MGAWLELFRSLGQALIELIKAEVAEVREQVAASGKHLAIAVGLMLAAAMVAFWFFALLIYTAVEVLALWLPRWGAAATVAGVFLVLVLALAGAGYFKLRRLESPTEIFGRQWRDHREWWNRRLLAIDDELPPGAVPPAPAVPRVPPAAATQPEELS